MAELSDDEFRTEVARCVAEGGWSSIRSIVDLVDIDDLRSKYYFLDEEEENEDDFDEEEE
jgi:hypothetical protein